MSARLLIDAGNSRLKWALVADGAWLARGVSGYEDWSALESQLETAPPCFIASVAGTGHEQALAARLAAAGCAATWLQAAAELAGVTNTYRSPRQLGVDRWMGLIAARQRCSGAVLVVSVGTAMTVDALSAGGVFLGGLIAPGAGLMRQALRQGTARVGESSGQWQAFPRATGDAVESGIVAALCGAIERQHAQLAEATAVAPRCLVTGGGAEAVLRHLRVAVEHVPDLVLEGIDLASREPVSG